MDIEALALAIALIIASLSIIYGSYEMIKE